MQNTDSGKDKFRVLLSRGVPLIETQKMAQPGKKIGVTPRCAPTIVSAPNVDTEAVFDPSHSILVVILIAMPKLAPKFPVSGTSI